MNESNKAFWEIIIRSIGTSGTIVLGIAIFLIFNNVRRKFILYKNNVLVLKLSGLVLILIGLVCIILINHLFDVHTIETARYYLLLIIGGCFNFFASTLEIGIQLKEEQKLTI